MHLVLGGGGHAKVVIDILTKVYQDEIMIFDDNVENVKTIEKVSIYGAIKECMNFSEHPAIIAIGNNYKRREIAEKYKLSYFTAIHPSAVIGEDVKIGEGSVIMANVVVNSGAKIGNHCILNTGATIDHDCVLGDYVHVSPGAHLAGNVQIGALSWIGMGTNIINGIKICNDAIVGAGAVVIRDINEKGTYIGVPAKIISGGTY